MEIFRTVHLKFYHQSFWELVRIDQNLKFKTIYRFKKYLSCSYFIVISFEFHGNNINWLWHLASRRGSIWEDSNNVVLSCISISSRSLYISPAPIIILKWIKQTRWEKWKQNRPGSKYRPNKIKSVHVDPHNTRTRMVCFLYNLQ